MIQEKILRIKAHSRVERQTWEEKITVVLSMGMGFFEDNLP